MSTRKLGEIKELNRVLSALIWILSNCNMLIRRNTAILVKNKTVSLGRSQCKLILIYQF